MKDLSRRFFMRAIGAVPGAAVALDLQAKAAAHGVPLLPLSDVRVQAQPAAAAGPTKFLDFGEWWKKFGHEDAESRARHVSHFDADILSMVSVSLTSKIRMQRARNFEQIKIEQERDFLSRIARDGHFNWWP